MIHHLRQQDSRFNDRPSPSGIWQTGGWQTGGWQTGTTELDRFLPDHRLNPAALHEIEPLRPTDMPWLTGFALGLFSRLPQQGPLVWCVTREQAGDNGRFYAHGAERYGLNAARIVFAKVNHPLHLHFALEEALKTDGVAGVMGEGPLPDFTGSRRLAMLAKSHDRPCLYLNPLAGQNRGSVAQTRFQIKPTTGVTDPLDPFGPGLPTWLVSLARVRGGHPSSYPQRIVWDEQTHAFRPASNFSDRAVPQSGAERNTIEPVLGARTG